MSSICSCPVGVHYMSETYRLLRQRKIWFFCSLLAVWLLLTVSGGVFQVRATSSEPACAVTPNLLGGQGFSVSGQGFSVSGQGFSVSGQGFSVSGQGFSVSGQGLDPLVVAAEIRDNPVTPGKWVNDRLNFFINDLSFNTEATAIIIVDEFTGDDPHGVSVRKVVDDSLAAIKTRVPGLRIDTFTIDISEAGTAYNADVIATKISTLVNSLKSSYRHFVLNMSFGLISCTDPGPVVNGTQLPAFDFNQAAEVVEANNQETPSLPITPILECVIKKPASGGYGGKAASGKGQETGDNYDTYIAYFGYKSENAQLVNIAVGSKNFFNTSPQGQGQPVHFEPGRQTNVFSVTFKAGSSLTWKVKGPDGQFRSVTATKFSTPCAAVLPTPSQPVTPILECVANIGEGMYEARFGYNNPNTLGVNISVGYKNQFLPSPPDRGQITTFAPGAHESVFAVSFNGSNLTWKLNNISVTANKDTEACPEPEGFGVSQYLTQNLGVPEEQVGAYWGQLTNNITSDEFQTLRQLLQSYLADSADPSKNFTAVVVASSGNLRPWLGDAPLAPASWDQSIAVGATLNDHDEIWMFSQDANVVAPGVGYPLGNNSFAAGTSFAAPAFSVLVGMCSTTPGALHFDGTNPPLELDASGGKVYSNAVIGVNDLSPLNCTLNSAPTVSPISDRTDKEGTSVSFNVEASDADGDPLTYAATGLPSGVSINSAGKISGTLAAGSAGVYNVEITVNDNHVPPASAQASFKWTVTTATSGVQIDIRPYSKNNRINLASRGYIAAAVLGSKTFDPTVVDPKTVTLAGAPVVKLFGRPNSLIFDVNWDGKLDRVFWFKVQDLQLNATSTEAVLVGKTFYGLSFQGTDKVKIVAPYAPSLSSPANNSTSSSKIVKLTWTDQGDWEEGDNVCYLVQIAKTAGFTNPLQGAIVVDRLNMNTIPLSNGTYFWRVAFSDCSSTVVSSWSETWSFKVK